MKPKKKKAEIKKKKSPEHKHEMKRKNVWRYVSKQAMTPHFTCSTRIRIFLTWDNKWYLHRDSSLQHSFHPKLDHSATTLVEKDLQNNDLKLVSFKYYFL
jgi:hypothetical protein